MQFKNMNQLRTVWGSEDQDILEGWKVIFSNVVFWF